VILVGNIGERESRRLLSETAGFVLRGLPYILAPTQTVVKGLASRGMNFFSPPCRALIAGQRKTRRLVAFAGAASDNRDRTVRRVFLKKVAEKGDFFRENS